MSDIETASKVTEITVNVRKLAIKCKSNRKASGAIKNLRRYISRTWNTSLPVYISSDDNKKVFSRGNYGTIGKMRLRIERGKCAKNPEQDCYKVSLVEVSSFKGLKDQVVVDDE